MIIDIIKSLSAGIFCGIIFNIFKLPCPAPLALNGIIGILGIYIVYIIININKNI